jgi:hypothetical protein
MALVGAVDRGMRVNVNTPVGQALMRALTRDAACRFEPVMCTDSAGVSSASRASSGWRTPRWRVNGAVVRPDQAMALRTAWHSECGLTGCFAPQ